MKFTFVVFLIIITGIVLYGPKLKGKIIPSDIKTSINSFNKVGAPPAKNVGASSLDKYRVREP